ncbi:MAG: hypothetical protein COX77_01335 [Candidatus Komeilibacteria bacterium CG_4_10_14_0_2_um_filter_37_10]|uniref:Uncharacterized protein n=1 Tax=Candidatus Komeilibacteria bacterium CG_4_10_14_0_2_um_filter_37_10 TaxID=1974470 RepID=A0A2M7VFY2_9BACT|nr:MAG: hypothetical protein COX77_01335 [Candidatus Komeilibacteria bacterium CG_4_10_14_0_2_um_filter_37_10]
MELTSNYSEMSQLELDQEIAACEKVISDRETDPSDLIEYQELRTALCKIRKQKFQIDFEPFE